MRLAKVIATLTKRRASLQRNIDAWQGAKTGRYFYIDAERVALGEALALCESEKNKRMVELYARNEESNETNLAGLTP